MKLFKRNPSEVPMSIGTKGGKHWILIIVGTIFWSLTMVKSGLVYKFGSGFWGANGHDGIWHISLASSLARGTFDMPIFSGEKIKNYHLGFDMMLAGLHVLTKIPLSTLYFQILPVIFAVAIGLLTFKLTKSWWSVFFVYFGGSLGWVFGGGESMFWSQQSISTLINPPYALSLIVMLIGLILIKRQKYLWAGLIFAILPHIKIYAGILAFAGLLISSLRDRNLLKTFGLGLLIYLPSNYQLITNNSSLIEWQPGWFLETMMAISDRFNWPRYYEAMINYKAAKNIIKGVPAYLIAFLIFFVGNMSTRLLGFLKFSKENIFYYVVIILGTILPMLFVQKGTAWNTIQFFYYSLFFAGILAGLSIQRFPKLLKILIVILTIPTTWFTLPNYLPMRPPAMISNQELEALNFLKRQSPGIIMTPVFERKDSEAPRPLYEYESTAYVSAYSNHPTFLEDEVNLNITGYDWPKRHKDLLWFWQTQENDKAQEFLLKNKIKYLYLPQVSNNRPQINLDKVGFKNIFENSQTAIWSRQL